MKPHHSITTPALAILFTFCLLFTACTNENKRQTVVEDDAKEAKGLELYRDGDCWVAKIISPTDSTRNLGVYIFPDTEESKNIPNIPGAGIFPPSRRGKIMAYTSVHTSALKELDAQDIIRVVGDAQYFTDSYIQEGLKNGKITDGGLMQEPVTERIIAAKPDMIILSHYDGIDIKPLSKLNTSIIYMRESSEETPLGRAEWIKLLGLIAGKKEKADSIYESVKKQYSALSAQAKKGNKPYPSVMTENMYQGVWALPGGKSYAAQLIKDAGGKYIWDSDKSSGSLQLSFEAVLGKASDADIWLIRSFGTDMDLATLKNMDSRYMLFKPAKNGGIWNANTEKVPLYDETPFHPDRLLKDYILIFHPEVLPNAQPVYYKRVTE